MRKEIDLTNPRLGSELLEDPKGDFPLDVWKTYCRTSGLPFSVRSWRRAPKTAALDPQEAVDEAMTLAIRPTMSLQSNQPAKAMEAARLTLDILSRGSSFSQPKRGQPASMRPIAVRAWIIRKFNPHPTKARVRDRLNLAMN